MVGTSSVTAPHNDGSVGVLLKKAKNLVAQLQGEEEREPCPQQHQNESLQRQRRSHRHQQQSSIALLQRQSHHLNDDCRTFDGFRLSEHQTRQENKQHQNIFDRLCSGDGRSPQPQQSSERLAFPSVPWGCGELVQQPKQQQQQQRNTFDYAVSVEKQWQQQQQQCFPTAYKHFPVLQGPQEQQQQQGRGEETARRLSFELPEKQEERRDDFKTRGDSQFTTSDERSPEARSSSSFSSSCVRLVHHRCHSTIMHSISAAAATAVTWQLLFYIFSIGYCCWLPLEAPATHLLPSSLSKGRTASLPLIFAAASDYAAAPAYRQQAASGGEGGDGDSAARDNVRHCSRYRIKEAPPQASSTVTWSTATSCSPAGVVATAAATAAGGVRPQTSGGFSLQSETSSRRVSEVSSIHTEDAAVASVSQAAIAAVFRAAAAIKHMYMIAHPYLPSMLQLWKLRYPETTFPHCLNYPTIEELSSDARAVRPALQRLKKKTFFRIFKFRLLAESCADTRLSELLNTRPDICTEPQRCGLCECSEDEVPSVWRQVPDEEFVDRRHAASFTRWTQHKSSRQPDDPFSIFKAPERSRDDSLSDMPASTAVSSSSSGSSSSRSNYTQSRGVYVDLLLNPPMYTRYEGGDVWRFLYSQVPLPSTETIPAPHIPPASAAAASAAPAASSSSLHVSRTAPRGIVAGEGNSSSSGHSNTTAAAAGDGGGSVGSQEGWPLVENEYLTDAQLCSSNANLRRVLSGMQANIAALAAENFFAVQPPNGHFDPRAAFPLIPSSVSPIRDSAASDTAAAAGGRMPTAAEFSSDSSPSETATSALSSASFSSLVPPQSSVEEEEEDENAYQTTSATTSSVLGGSPTPPSFARNLPFFRERLADQRLRVQNLYFVFGLLLRTVCSLSDVLQECSCETGNRGEDLSARADLLHVLNVTTVSTYACSPRYMNQPLFDSDHLAFLSSMESTDSLLRCIRCEKCRLHGKIKLGALYVAGKVLSSTESLPFLERNQVTALINALYYFADAIRVVEEMQEQINRHNIAVYLLLACLALLVVLTVAFYAPRNRSRRKTLMWRTCESPSPSGGIDAKKLQ